MLSRGSNIPVGLKLPDSLPKTAVIGAAGFLGSAFLASYRSIHADCAGTDGVAREGVIKLDLLSTPISSLNLSKSGHKDAIILASIPKIALCESDKELTRKINVTATLEVIRQLAAEGIKPIFASSDYVFDGASGGYSDDALLNPITEYGRQKAEVESQISEITGGNYLVIRPGKVFSLEKGSGTLLDEMASTLARGGTVRAAFDQIFCSVMIADLIEAVAAVQALGVKGILNVCSDEPWARYDLAVAIAAAMGISSDNVARISIDELGVGPKRPKNTSMKAERLTRLTGYRFTPMFDCITKTAANWRNL